MVNSQNEKKIEDKEEIDMNNDQIKENDSENVNNDNIKTDFNNQVELKKKYFSR